MRKPVVLLFVILVACGATESAAPTTTDPADAGPGTPSTYDPSAPTGLPCNVDAILAKNCRTCHTSPPQYGAPMALTSYAALHAPAHTDPSLKVYEKVILRINDDAHPMPPSPNERLSAADRATLKAWADAGAPESSESCTTKPPDPVQPTTKCTPDLKMRPGSKWTMPKDTKDEYVCYGFDIERPSPTHIVGWEPHIDNKTIVHHVLLFEAPSSVDPTPTPCEGGGSATWRIITGWAPGGKGMELPPDVGFPLVEGGKTHYVMQVHYSNVNALDGETDESGFDLCTAPPRAQEADVIAFGSRKFTIPATNQPYTIDCTVQVPQQLAGKKIISSLPHMHKLGTSITTTLERGSNPPVDLGTVKSWSFDNQTWYPVTADTKTNDVIRTKCTWTNKTGAPVDYGEKTADEMCYSFTTYYPRIESPIWSWAIPAVSSQCN